jgi:hypothetical protein
MRRCHACGSEIAGTEKFRRTDECPGCGRDLRCCRNCRHFHPAARNQCLEPIAEWASDKERANFCDEFVFGDARGALSPGTKRPEEDARDRWKHLFAREGEKKHGG